MSYEETGTKKVTDIKAVMIADAKKLSTPSLLWILVTRHKVAILAVGNIVLVLNWAFPQWPSFISSLMQ